MPKTARPQPGQLALFDDTLAGEEPAAAEPEPLARAAVDPAPRRRLPDQTRRARAADPAEGRVAAPDVLPSPDVTLDQALPVYLAALAALGRSQHTLKSFELDLRLLRGQLGNRPVGSIDLRHLRQFIAWVRLSRENTPNSLRRKVATLKNFFGYLHNEGYLRSNIADALPYPEAYVALPEYLDDAAAKRLADATGDNPFWRALVLLLLDTGLKRDEALALRVADVHLELREPGEAEAGFLVVRETDAAKRLRSRRLPLTERLRDALLAYYAQTPRDGGESRVFDVSVRGINFIVETCGARAGIVTTKPRLTPQVLRETFAVAQMRARVQDEQRRRAGGWREEALQLLALRHDAEVLELLGLKEDPDTARKYRQLAGT